jgi:hypothetical protein
MLPDQLKASPVQRPSPPAPVQTPEVCAWTDRLEKRQIVHSVILKNSRREINRIFCTFMERVVFGLIELKVLRNEPNRVLYFVYSPE